MAKVNGILSQPDSRSVFEACATILLLCLTELFDGTSRVWKWHLKAASAILKANVIQSLVPSDEWAFCTNLFNYLDSMSTISRCKAPLLRSDNTISELATNKRRANVPALEFNKSMTAIYGIPPDLFDFLGMVNTLANQRSKRTDELSDIGFRAAAANIETAICEWRTEYDRSPEPEISSKQATIAFEWAIRLRLHQVVEGYDIRHESVERAVVMILGAVQRVPYASRVEGCLLFPLVIAGSCSISIERRMMVKERLMVMENTLGFNHIQYARQLLETIWSDVTCEYDFNWAAVRYSQFPGVVFV